MSVQLFTLRMTEFQAQARSPSLPAGTLVLASSTKLVRSSFCRYTGPLTRRETRSQTVKRARTEESLTSSDEASPLDSYSLCSEFLNVYDDVADPYDSVGPDSTQYRIRTCGTGSQPLTHSGVTGGVALLFETRNDSTLYSHDRVAKNVEHNNAGYVTKTAVTEYFYERADSSSDSEPVDEGQSIGARDCVNDGYGRRPSLSLRAISEIASSGAPQLRALPRSSQF
ncbi:hypothetical protein OH77DRAFT_160070 [Trametes cingulata]|nr:hypothetical protein OH77DRAFT_160070 [Trametes cingulata]